MKERNEERKNETRNQPHQSNNINHTTNVKKGGCGVRMFSLCLCELALKSVNVSPVSKNGWLDYPKNLERNVCLHNFPSALCGCAMAFSQYLSHFQRSLIRDPPFRSAVSTHTGQIVKTELSSSFFFTTV